MPGVCAPKQKGAEKPVTLYFVWRAFLSECDGIFFAAKGQTRSRIDRRQASLPHIRRLYAAYHRIGKHILHLCGGSSADPDPIKPTGAFLTGIAPETSVKALNVSGYTVYSGKTEITSGYVGTGMTAVSGNASLTIVVTGDVTGDGRITITDVVKLQNYAAGAGDLDEAAMKAADINGDGRITITDVVQAAQVTVGQRTI